MKVRNFLHKGLQRFYEGGSSKGLPVGATDKLAKMLAVLDALRGEDQLRTCNSGDRIN
jgi:plasmid maintenance system killer protein